MSAVNLRIKDKCIAYKKSLYLWSNRVRLSFRIRRAKGKIKIYVHKKNKPKINRLKWIVSILGLLLSLVLLPILYAFLIALFLFALTILLEHVFFFYTSFYIHYIPDFEINNDFWLGMSYGYGETPDRKHQIPMVGLVFSNRDYARKFFSLLRRWNYDSLEDRDNNFVISIILENDKEYFTYIYPNIGRKTAREFISEVESKSSTDMEHVRLFALIFTMKRFIITDKSYLPTFMRRYTDGIPYLLDAYVGTETNFRTFDDIPRFLKFNLKIQRHEDLTREDLEYDLRRIYVS